MKTTKPYTIIKLARTILIALLVATVAYVPILAAASPSADFNYPGDPIWSYGDVTVYSDGLGLESINDLFGLATKELAPGMKREVNIRLENHSGDTYSFYLKAQAKTEDDASSLERFFPGKTAEDSLLDAIDTIIYYTGGNIYTTEGVIYEGKLAGKPGADMYNGAHGVLLGTLGANSHGTVRAAISIPEGLGNEYMDTLCAIDWWFTAAMVEAPQTPGPTPPVTYPPTTYPPATYPPESGQTDPPPTSVIPPNPVPTGDPDGNISNETDIGDIEVPKEDIVIVVDPGGKLPQTGGIATFVIPTAIALTILLLLLAITFIRKKDKRRDSTIT